MQTKIFAVLRSEDGRFNVKISKNGKTMIEWPNGLHFNGKNGNFIHKSSILVLDAISTIMFLFIPFTNADIGVALLHKDLAELSSQFKIGVVTSDYFMPDCRASDAQTVH